MKKLTTLGFVLCLTSTAAFADLSQGDGTYLPQKEFKSSVSRDAVVAKTDSRNIGNSMDSTFSPSSTAGSNVSRAEVLNKMNGHQFADFGDGTNLQPWTRSQEAPRSLANKAPDASGKSMN